MFGSGKRAEEAAAPEGRYRVEPLEPDPWEPTIKEAHERLQEALERGAARGWQAIHFSGVGGARGLPSIVVWDTQPDSH